MEGSSGWAGEQGSLGGSGCGAGHSATSAASERLLDLFAGRLLRHRALEALHLRVSVRGCRGRVLRGREKVLERAMLTITSRSRWARCSRCIASCCAAAAACWACTASCSCSLEGQTKWDRRLSLGAGRLARGGTRCGWLIALFHFLWESRAVPTGVPFAEAHQPSPGYVFI